MMNLQQNPCGQWKRAASLRHETAQLRNHECDKDCDQNGPSQCEKSRINQGLLDTISQFFCLHQMLDQSKQNLRERTAGLARSHQIYIQRWKNSRHLIQRL